MQYTALYCRVSTANYQHTGLESQVRALKEYCISAGIKEHKLFTDEGVSGAKTSRPGLDALMASVCRGEVKSVVVYSFSRFSRSTRHLLSALEIFNERRIGFVSLSERLDTTTPTGKMIFTVLAAVAALEREILIERVKNGLRNAKAKGKILGRPKTRNDNLILTLLSQGMTYRQISKLANCSHWCIREVLKKAHSTEIPSAIETAQKLEVG